ncbi:MAG: cytochrome-c oxidase, cbb3-type subunit III [Pseudomonadota bacterium]
MSDDEKRVDDVTGIETTGHSYDGIEELNTPLPKWWLWTFYLTCIWGVIYTIAYPAWPLINSATAGLLGYSTRAEVAADIAAHEEQNAPLVEELLEIELASLDLGGDLARYSTQRGAAVFRAHCSQCHGAGAAGAVGYPNLLDDDWLWGGALESIAYTVRHGIRNETDWDAHYSEMPAYGEILTEEEIVAVVEHVETLFAGGPANALGAQIFEENCAACHGEAGLGDPEIGAPNIADAIWLYGGDRDTLIETVTHARFGVMPAWGQRISEEDVRAVAIYVHGLGGGE